MLDIQYFGLSVNYVAHVLAAFVTFAVSWLVFDAWSVRRSRVELVKGTGFSLIALGFMAAAATLTGTAHVQLLQTSGEVLRLIGYLAVAVGQLADPLQKRPTVDSLLADRPAGQRHAAPAAVAFGPITVPVLALTIGLSALAASLLYWRRSSTGLERHLRPVAVALAGLAAYEGLQAMVGLSTTNPLLEQATAVFGAVWWGSIAILVCSALILGRWVWRYLTKRLSGQLFLTLLGQALAIFLVGTVGFSYIAHAQSRANATADLATASRVLAYALAAQQKEAAAQAAAVVERANVQQAVAAHSHEAAVGAVSRDLADKQLSTILITDDAGMVLARAEDDTRWGDARSSDPLIRRALTGQAATSVKINQGAVAPQVSLLAASPVRTNGGAIVGAVLVGRHLSNAFVDGIKQSTRLDSSVYGGDRRAATTLVASAAGKRATGTTIDDSAVVRTVLQDGEEYAGVVFQDGQAYVTAITPLTDVDNSVVGMLEVNRPAQELVNASSVALQQTFIGSIALLLLSLYPLRRLARFIEQQVH